jgi:predicted GNAT family acetyltransferase
MGTWQLFEDAAAFLDAAERHLAVDPLLSTVVATVARREVGSAGAPVTGRPHWYAALRDPAGEVVGAAMRTAPTRPHPLFVLPVPEDDARALARLLHGRGERVGGVNGTLPSARVVAEETARLTGGEVTVRMHTRLFELREVVAPRRTEGAPRTATEDDLELVLAWFEAFGAEADEQAGRSRGHDGETVSRDDVLARVRGGHVVLWEVGGEAVHLTAHNPPAYGVVRIGPVYTPRPHRGRGYARAAVAEVSRRVLDAGHRPCLFTDQANPVSNKVYERIGYTAVTDMANLLVGPAGGRSVEW